MTFTDPEVGSVGLTEHAAHEKGMDVETVEYDLAALAGTYVMREDYVGRAKLVIDRASDTIVGATFVGSEIADLVHAATVAIVAKVPLAAMWHAVPSYPTPSEIWLRLLETLGRQRQKAHRQRPSPRKLRDSGAELAGCGVDQTASFITVATADLDAARDFYVGGLGWTPTLDVPGEIIFFQVGHGLMLGLFEAGHFSADLGDSDAPSVPIQGLTLSQNVGGPEEVDRVVSDAVRAGAAVVKAAAVRRVRRLPRPFPRPERSHLGGRPQPGLARRARTAACASTRPATDRPAPRASATAGSWAVRATQFRASACR